MAVGGRTPPVHCYASGAESVAIIEAASWGKTFSVKFARDVYGRGIRQHMFQCNATSYQGPGRHGRYGAGAADRQPEVKKPQCRLRMLDAVTILWTFGA